MINMDDYLNITTFLLFPMTMILLVSLSNVFLAVRGKFHPMDVMLKGLGGAMYIFGFGWVATDNMAINPGSASLLMWGLAIKLIPRLVQILMPQSGYVHRIPRQ